MYLKIQYKRGEGLHTVYVLFQTLDVSFKFSQN